MSALILKSANHLYKLVKVYSTMALLGALAVIVVEIVLAKPVVLIAVFVLASFASTVVLLLAQSQGRRHMELSQRGSQNLHEPPPKLPESLMAVALPAELADHVMGDLSEEFYRLRSKYGRYSAVTWYTIQSATIFVKATALHCGLSSRKSLTQFLKKQSS